MNLAEHLLDRLTPANVQELHSKRGMDLNRDILKNEIIFCDEFVKASLDNLALNLGGHKAEISYRFNEDKFLIWCGQNDIEVRESPFFDGFIISAKNTSFWEKKMAENIVRTLKTFDL